jgi:hypothetical protein
LHHIGGGLRDGDFRTAQTTKTKEPKKLKDKNGDALVGRVKKVIKKSRRKMGDEKFAETVIGKGRCKSRERF